MNTDFIPGNTYAAMQTMSPFALKRGHAPLHYTDLVFVETVKDENGVIEHKFQYEYDFKWFDDAFVNNGKAFDNSMIIVEVKTCGILGTSDNN